MIRAEHIHKSFRNIRAVHDISFEIKPGEIIGLLGPNGSGKTTVLRMVAGFFPPSSGSILIDDMNLYTSHPSIRARIGYLPERVPLYDALTVDEFLHYVSELKGVVRAQRKTHLESIVSKCNLESVRNRLIGKLSKGFRERTGLAQALIGDPDILVLDEPTIGLDPRQTAEFRSLIKALSKNKIVLLSSHLLSEVSMLCSRVLIMDQGALLASGSPKELEETVRNSAELVVAVRGAVDRLERALQNISGIIAVRLDRSSGSEHELRIRYQKKKDIRPLLSRTVVDVGLELLSLREVPIALEEIFLKMTDRGKES